MGKKMCLRNHVFEICEPDGKTCLSLSGGSCLRITEDKTEFRRCEDCTMDIPKESYIQRARYAVDRSDMLDKILIVYEGQTAVKFDGDEYKKLRLQEAIDEDGVEVVG